VSEGEAESAAPPTPARVELGTAAIVRQRSSALARLSLWAAATASMATAFIKQAWPVYKVYFEEPIPGFKRAVYNQVRIVEPNAALLKALTITITLLLSLAALSYLATRKKRTYGAVRIEGDEIVLVYSDRPEHRVAIAELVSVVDTSGGAELELENGSRIEIVGGARDALVAEIAKRRSKLDRLRAPRGMLEVPMGGAITKALPWLGWFFLLGGWQGAGQAFAGGSYFNVVLLSLFTAAWLAVAAWHWSPARVTIGADGVRLSGRGRPRFVSFARVRDVEIASSKVSLRLDDGSAVVVGRHEPTLLARLGAALEGYRAPTNEGHGPNQHEHVLRRGDRSSADWRAQLQKLAHKQDYRAEVLDEEALASVVADARVDPEQRVAAALALPKSDEARARIRVAAQRSADEDLQRALGAAAEDEVAEAELARAMQRRA
jgi:hypothetical protein